MYRDSLELIIGRLQENRRYLVNILYDMEKAIGDYDCDVQGCRIGYEREECRFKDDCPWLRANNILTNLEEMEGHGHRSI
jgi:hypothetical protein